jgi:hypothetical protein
VRLSAGGPIVKIVRDDGTSHNGKDGIWWNADVGCMVKLIELFAVREEFIVLRDFVGCRDVV